MLTVRCSGRLGGGRCLPRGCLPWEGCLPRGRGVCSGGLHSPRSPLPVDRTTDACENITFPQLLLQMVKGVSAQGGVHPPCGQNDRCLWKHYLSATTVADGKNRWNRLSITSLVKLNLCLLFGANWKEFSQTGSESFHIINPVNCISVQVMYWSW